MSTDITLQLAEIQARCKTTQHYQPDLKILMEIPRLASAVERALDGLPRCTCDVIHRLETEECMCSSGVTRRAVSAILRGEKP